MANLDSNEPVDSTPSSKPSFARDILWAVGLIVISVAIGWYVAAAVIAVIAIAIFGFSWYAHRRLVNARRELAKSRARLAQAQAEYDKLTAAGTYDASDLGRLQAAVQHAQFTRVTLLAAKLTIENVDSPIQTLVVSGTDGFFDLLDEDQKLLYRVAGIDENYVPLEYRVHAPITDASDAGSLVCLLDNWLEADDLHAEAMFIGRQDTATKLRLESVVIGDTDRSYRFGKVSD